MTSLATLWTGKFNLIEGAVRFWQPGSSRSPVSFFVASLTGVKPFGQHLSERYARAMGTDRFDQGLAKARRKSSRTVLNVFNGGPLATTPLPPAPSQPGNPGGRPRRRGRKNLQKHLYDDTIPEEKHLYDTSTRICKRRVEDESSTDMTESSRRRDEVRSGKSESKTNDVRSGRMSRRRMMPDLVRGCEVRERVRVPATRGSEV